MCLEGERRALRSSAPDWRKPPWLLVKERTARRAVAQTSPAGARVGRGRPDAARIAQSGCRAMRHQLTELPLPAHFDPSQLGRVWRVSYEARAREAEAWAEEHGLRPASEDAFRVCLVAIDVQNTFCMPDFELF